MENYPRTRLSINLALIKIFCSISVAFVILLLFNAETFNSQDLLECWFFLTVLTFFLLYSFILPEIFYDKSDLCIKKITKKELLIPLKDIISITERKFSTYRGISTYRIEYLRSGSQVEKIKFRGKGWSKSLLNFIDLVKTLNPDAKIMIQ